MIRLGIIGLGNFGRRHALAAEASGRFEVLSAVSKEPDSVRDFAEAQGIKLFTEIEDVLGDPEIEAVILATPHSLHTSQVVAAASAGKQVLTEKPFALSRADAVRAVEACHSAGVVLGLGHDNRQYPAVKALKQMLVAGDLGTPLHVETNLSHENMKRRADAAGHDAENYPGDPRHGADPMANYVPGPAWRLDYREAPTGPVIHMGVHRIDLFIHLFGEVDWVFAQSARHVLKTGFDDTASVLFRFKSGISGYLGTALTPPMCSRLQVFGNDGWVEITGPRDYGDYVRSSLRTMTVCKTCDEMETRTFDYVNSVQLNLEAFADAIEGKEEFPISPSEMIHNAAILDAIKRSIETGEKVPVE